MTPTTPTRVAGNQSDRDTGRVRDDRNRDDRRVRDDGNRGDRRVLTEGRKGGAGGASMLMLYCFPPGTLFLRERPPW